MQPSSFLGAMPFVATCFVASTIYGLASPKETTRAGAFSGSQDQLPRPVPPAPPPLPDEILLGTGFNTATGRERGDCVQRAAVVTAGGGTGGQRTHYYLRQ